MRGEPSKNAKSNGKIGADVILEAGLIGQEGVVTPEVRELRRTALLENLKALQQTQEHPYSVIYQNTEEFGGVFRGALAVKLLCEVLGKQEIPVNELVQLVETTALFDAALDGSADGLQVYFTELSAQAISREIQGSKFEGSFKLANSTREFIKTRGKELGEQTVRHVFRLLSNGTVDFQANVVEKSWEQLLATLKDNNFSISVLETQTIIANTPELRAIQLVLHQKEGEYIGLASPLTQIIMVASFQQPVDAAIVSFHQELGVQVRNNVSTAQLREAVEHLKNGTTTATELSAATVGLGKLVLLAGYQESTTTLILEAMKENCEMNEKMITAATIDRGTLMLAAKIGEKVFPETPKDKNELIQALIALEPRGKNTAIELVAERLEAYELDELAGIYFFRRAFENKGAAIKEKQEELATIFMNLLAGEIEVTGVLKQSLDEAILTAHGRQFKDISTVKFSALVEENRFHGVAALMSAFPADDTKEQENGFHEALVALDQLGRYEFAKIYLSESMFVVRKEFEERAATVGEKEPMTLGYIPVSGSTARWILAESKKRNPVNMLEFFVQDVEKMSAHEIVWSASQVSLALDREIAKFVGAGMQNFTTSSTKLKQKTSPKLDLHLLYEEGLPKETEVMVCRDALKALYLLDPKIFIDPATLSDDAIRAYALKMTHILRARTENVISFVVTKKNSQFQILSGLLPYRICESEEERHFKAIIYLQLFDAKNFTDEVSFSEILRQIREKIPNKLISNEDLKREVLIAVTNFASFTRYEMDPGILKLSTAPSSMNSVMAYPQLLKIRDEAFKLAWQNGRVTKAIPHEQPSPILRDTVQYLNQRAIAQQEEVNFENNYKLSLAIALKLFPVVKELNKLTLNEKEKKDIETIGLYLFPDFNKRQRRALALAFVEKIGASIVDMVRTAQEELQNRQQRIVGIVALSGSVGTLLSQLLEHDFAGIGQVGEIRLQAAYPNGIKEVTIQVGASNIDRAADSSPNIQPLPNLDEARVVQEPEISARNNILYAANQIVKATPRSNLTELSKEHAKHLPELYPGFITENRNREIAHQVVEIANWAEEVPTVQGSSSSNVQLVFLVLSQVLPEEIEAMTEIAELVKLGVSRLLIPAQEVLAMNVKMLEKLPIMRSTAEGISPDFVLALSNILTAEDSEEEIPQVLLREADSVYSIVTGDSNKESLTLVEDLEFLLRRAEEVLLTLLSEKEPMEQGEETETETETETEVQPLVDVPTEVKLESDQATTFDLARERLLESSESKPKKVKKKGVSPKAEKEKKSWDGTVKKKKKRKHQVIYD